MKASYIVCTRNRARSLIPTLDSIAAQSNAELVIVNNGSSDNTEQVIASWRKTVASPVTVVNEPGLGLSRARNAGARAASGDILVFTDDDCRVSADYSDKLFKAHSGSTPTIIGGKVLLGDPLDAPVTILLEDKPATLASTSEICGFIHGCNMTMPRAVLDRVGAFDPRFGAGAPLVSAEDTDYLYRAAALGIAVKYDPTITVSHYHGRRDVGDIMKLMAGYMVGRGAMAVKHRDLSFIKPVYWHAKAIFSERLRGHKRPVDKYRPSALADIIATARGMVKAVAVLNV